MKKEIKHKETNGIPICPYCQKPTKRIGGAGTTTLVYYPPIYNEKGENTNPDRNATTFNWYCEECGKRYQTVGNYVGGFHYK